MDVNPPSGGGFALRGAGPVAFVFVRDHASEAVIRQCLSDLAVSGAEFRVGGVGDAIADPEDYLASRGQFEALRRSLGAEGGR